MTKKKEWIVIGVFVLLIVAVTGVLLFAMGKGDKIKAAADLSTFSAYTDIELFQSVPTMQGKGIGFTEARDVGDRNYMIQAENSTKEEYDAYLKLLEEKGYTKYLDNGADGIEGNVYSAYYQKDELTLYVCYFVNTATTMINVCDNAVFSDHLFYDESYVADNIPGAKTTFHSPELYAIGNCFLFQLKNGHFILSDGGQSSQLLYLLDYMESLVPEGEKPVIEAWFITHSHGDHMGILTPFFENQEYAERVAIENIFFNAPTKEAYPVFQTFDQPDSYVRITKNAGLYVKNSQGENPTVYRPRIGERYYFCDITVDMVYTPELLPPEEWKTWNASCYVSMYNVEGQKVMITGDVEYNCQKIYMEIFDSEYFNIDVYQMPHHGKNVYIEFAHHCSGLRTLIFPTTAIGTEAEYGENISPQNKFFVDKAEEALTYGTGTKVLTFPYKPGEAVTLQRQEWIHNAKPSWVLQQE